MNTTEMQLLDWRPLEANVPLHDRANYMHMGVSGSIQMYKHRDTRRYLNIDADCVRFFVRKDTGELAEADRDSAFCHVHGQDLSRS